MEQTLSIRDMTRESQNEAIGQAVGSEIHRLRKYIARRVDSSPDAEDILQDTLLQFVSAMREEPIRTAAAWLYRVAGNRIIDWYRKRKPVPLETQQAGGDDEDAPGPYLLAGLLADPSASPEDQFMNMTIWTELNEALDELPANQKEVFVLHELEGKSFREIAGITGEPVPTLLSRKRYAVLYLRDRLRDLYEDLLS